MKFVFLGGMYPKNREKELFEKSEGRLSFAANLHQWNMVRGLEANMNEAINIINAYFLPSYPRYSDWKIHTHHWSHDEMSEDINVGFLNFRGVRYMSQSKGIYKELKLYLQKHISEQVVVFVYTMSYPQMKAVYELKKQGYDFHACLIVPDVPSILSKYGTRTGLYNRISSNYNLKHIEKYNTVMDSFVLLSEPMSQLVNVGERPYCVVDGMFSEAGKVTENNEELKTAVYTGSLHKEYGICDLLSSFQEIKKEDYRLIIAGTGNALEEVKKATESDSRISYVGSLAYDQVYALQQKATVLVNPRSISGIDAKYSFPSKTIEYMLSGRPVIMNCLPGMDGIYEEYLFTPKKCGCTGFADVIQHVCELPQEERNEFAMKARQFVIDNKSNVKQMEKVLSMIEEIIGHENNSLN